MSTERPDGPSYKQLSDASFARRIAALQSRYSVCDPCVDACGVDRPAGDLGTYHSDDIVHVSVHVPHFVEQDCL